MNLQTGTIDESLRKFTSRERAIAEMLAAEGKTVQAIPESLIPGQRSADALVDGEQVEFKSLAPGANHGTVKNALNASIKRGGQARDFVIDARGSGLTSMAAERAFNRIQGIARGKIARIRILGEDYVLSRTYS